MNPAVILNTAYSLFSCSSWKLQAFLHKDPTAPRYLSLTLPVGFTSQDARPHVTYSLHPWINYPWLRCSNDWDADYYTSFSSLLCVSWTQFKLIGHVAHSLGFENVVVLDIILMMFVMARTVLSLASPSLKSLILIPQLISGFHFSIISIKT